MIILVVTLIISIVSWRLVFFILRSLAGTRQDDHLRDRRKILFRGRARDQEYLSSAQMIMASSPLLWLLTAVPAEVGKDLSRPLGTSTFLMLGAALVWLVVYIYNLRYKRYKE